MKSVSSLAEENGLHKNLSGKESERDTNSEVPLHWAALAEVSTLPWAACC